MIVLDVQDMQSTFECRLDTGNMSPYGYQDRNDLRRSQRSLPLRHMIVAVVLRNIGISH